MTAVGQRLGGRHVSVQDSIRVSASDAACGDSGYCIGMWLVGARVAGGSERVSGSSFDF